MPISEPKTTSKGRQLGDREGQTRRHHRDYSGGNLSPEEIASSDSGDGSSERGGPSERQGRNLEKGAGGGEGEV